MRIHQGSLGDMRTQSLDERPRLKRQEELDTSWGEETEVEERLRNTETETDRQTDRQTEIPRVKRLLECVGRQHRSEDLNCIRVQRARELATVHRLRASFIRRKSVSTPCSPSHQRSVAIMMENSSSLVSLPLPISTSPPLRPRLRLDLTRKQSEMKSPQESHWTALCFTISVLTMVVSLLCAFFSVSSALSPRSEHAMTTSPSSSLLLTSISSTQSSLLSQEGEKSDRKNRRKFGKKGETERKFDRKKYTAR